MPADYFRAVWRCEEFKRAGKSVSFQFKLEDCYDYQWSAQYLNLRQFEGLSLEDQILLMVALAKLLDVIVLNATRAVATGSAISA